VDKHAVCTRRRFENVAHHAPARRLRAGFATGAWAAADERKCDSEIYTAIERDLRLAKSSAPAQASSQPLELK
jgi:hypothetical protein